jgi:hypothetical protein
MGIANCQVLRTKGTEVSVRENSIIGQWSEESLRWTSKQCHNYFVHTPGIYIHLMVTRWCAHSPPVPGGIFNGEASGTGDAKGRAYFQIGFPEPGRP